MDHFTCLFANSLFEKSDKSGIAGPRLSNLSIKITQYLPQITRVHCASAGMCPPHPTCGVRTDPCSACASCPGCVCAWATIFTASARASASKKWSRSLQVASAAPHKLASTRVAPTQQGPPQPSAGTAAARKARPWRSATSLRSRSRREPWPRKHGQRCCGRGRHGRRRP